MSAAIRFWEAAPFPRLRVPVRLYEGTVAAGFPSPADGYQHQVIDLNELLIQNPPATFITRASGQSMIHAPIQDGDHIIVNRALEQVDGDLVLAVLDGEFTVKTYRRTPRRAWLQAENPAFPDIEITEEREASVWGIITGSFRQYKRGQGRGNRG